VITAYRIDAGDDERWVWLYCPVCAAVYPVASFEDPACPNADQNDHHQDDHARDDCGGEVRR
jgi:hypothetical protein